MKLQQIRAGLSLVGVAALLAGCGAASRAATPTALSAAVPAPATAISIALPASLVPAPPVQPTTAPATSSTGAPSADGAAPPYLDDRSTAEALLNSLYNAVNRKEYVRAYAYWQGAADLPPYEAFAQGYHTTSAVQVGYGTVRGDTSAGQTRFSVPASITSATSDGTQYFLACYTLHLGSPAAQATLPFQPLAIEAAVVQQRATPPAAAAIAQACQGQGSALPPPTVASDAIDQSVYRDNQSDPVNVVRSFYNAINRHEYVRAYSVMVKNPLHISTSACAFTFCSRQCAREAPHTVTAVKNVYHSSLTITFKSVIVAAPQSAPALVAAP